MHLQGARTPTSAHGTGEHRETATEIARNPSFLLDKLDRNYERPFADWAT